MQQFHQMNLAIFPSYRLPYVQTACQGALDRHSTSQSITEVLLRFVHWN